MFRSPWFTLVVGLMVGLAVGYALAERQPVPPARALAAVTPGGAPSKGMPEGHPPLPSGGGQQAVSFDQQRARLLQMQSERPDDPKPMIALGNLSFDAGQWDDARTWYEKALPLEPSNPDLLTDLAVALRNLRQPERALELLDRSTQAQPDHWQSWYNRVVVLHYDLHRHDEAVAALERLEQIKAAGAGVPDLTALRRDVTGE
jgi:tetratricopeptide (TPR) repeat protein